MKTSISEKIAYGMGDVACNVVYACLLYTSDAADD